MKTRVAHDRRTFVPDDECPDCGALVDDHEDWCETNERCRVAECGNPTRDSDGKAGYCGGCTDKLAAIEASGVTVTWDGPDYERAWLDAAAPPVEP